MTATVTEVIDVPQTIRGAASPLPHKALKITYESGDTQGPEIDMRGFRKVTVHAPTPATTSSATKATAKAAPESGGTFGTVNDNDNAADVEFTLNGKANSTLRLAGMGYLRLDLDAAYTTGTSGTDTDVYVVLS